MVSKQADGVIRPSFSVDQGHDSHASVCPVATNESSAREVFGHSRPRSSGSNPTGYMFTSSGFDAFIHLRYILQIPHK